MHPTQQGVMWEARESSTDKAALGQRFLSREASGGGATYARGKGRCCALGTATVFCMPLKP
jgi:hypothetical protein